VVLFF